VLEVLADFHQHFPCVSIVSLELSEPYFVAADGPIKGKNIRCRR